MTIQRQMKHLLSSNGKYYSWLIWTAAVLAIVLFTYELVRAEKAWDWDAAQASLVAILLLLGLIVWRWWIENRKPPPVLSVEAATYSAAIRNLRFCIAVGLTLVVLSGTREKFWEYHVVAKAIAYLTIAAGFFFVFGVLLGLLFAFRPTGIQNLDEKSPSARRHPITNLEEIADWFTKLILGAGLVELTHLRKPIGYFAWWMAQGVNPLPPDNAELGSPPVALAIMGFFSASGVLYGFLWKRYECAVTLDESYADTSALALVDTWLTAASTPDDRTRAEMMKSVKSASLATKVRIFLQAEQFRQSATQDVNERSLPVFQALVEADLQEMFHRSRGQYAFALMGRKKDPRSPDADWNQALDSLNNAIQIRDAAAEKGWQEYEFARAVCQIHLDPNFRQKLASSAQEKQSILTDLDKARFVPEVLKKAIDSDSIIDKWVTLNP